MFPLVGPARNPQVTNPSSQNERAISGSSSKQSLACFSGNFPPSSQDNGGPKKAIQDVKSTSIPYREAAFLELEYFVDEHLEMELEEDEDMVDKDDLLELEYISSISWASCSLSKISVFPQPEPEQVVRTKTEKLEGDERRYSAKGDKSMISTLNYLYGDSDTW